MLLSPMCISYKLVTMAILSKRRTDWLRSPNSFCNKDHTVFLIIKRLLCSRCPLMGFYIGNGYLNIPLLFQELYAYNSSLELLSPIL